MASLFFNILGSVIAAILVACALVWHKRLLNFVQRRRILSAGPRLASAGISNFFTSRNDYNKYRHEKTLEEFIKSAKTSFAYFGIAFSTATGPTRLDSTFRDLLSNGVSVDIYIVDASSSVETLDAIGLLYGVNRKHVRTTCGQALAHFREFYDSLPIDQKGSFRVFLHEAPISYSAFVFDRGQKSQKLLVDYKIFGIGKDSSFGIQFDGVDESSTLYYRLIQSLDQIRQKYPNPVFS